MDKPKPATLLLDRLSAYLTKADGTLSVPAAEVTVKDILHDNTKPKELRSQYEEKRPPTGPITFSVI